jgi:hypothetical protein
MITVKSNEHRDQPKHNGWQSMAAKSKRHAMKTILMKNNDLHRNSHL